jgi:hypothetical protein
MTPESLARARAALHELRNALQSAHFAARQLEAEFPPQPAERLSDRIHAVRKEAERLRVALSARAPEILPLQ